MIKYKEFSPKTDFDSWITSQNQTMGFPSTLSNTTSYTRLLEHPSLDKGICAVDESYTSDIDQEEIDTLKDRDYLYTAGYIVEVAI